MNPEKHLLPKDILNTQRKRHNDDFVLPFPSIDIIFNHKNIWANLQNSNPQIIKYHLHKVDEWLPLIAEPRPGVLHPRLVEKELLERLQKNNEDYEPPEEDDEEIEEL